MQPAPEFDQTYPPPPPPPPPQRSRKGLWIALGIGAGILCLCCILLIAGIFFFRLNVPVISNFFPSPTPTGLIYSNPSAGISLTYPQSWQYSESGDASSGYTIIFASSPDILNNSTNAPMTGAALAIMTNVLATSDLPFSIDASSMGSVVDYIATNYFSNISGGQNLRNFTVSGYPAASGVYTLSDSTGAPSAAYIIAVMKDTEIIFFYGICPQAEWAQYQPTFDTILSSTNFAAP